MIASHEISWLDQNVGTRSGLNERATCNKVVRIELVFQFTATRSLRGVL